MDRSRSSDAVSNPSQNDVMLPRTHSPGWPTINQLAHNNNFNSNEKDDIGEKLVMPEIMHKSPMNKKDLVGAQINSNA